MYAKYLLMICLLVASWSTSYAAAKPIFDPQAAAADSIEMRGLLELSYGNPDNAYTLFRYATTYYPDTRPANYTPTLYMGLAKCLSGDKATAKKHFEDFRCMVQVAAGDLPCPRETDPTKLRHLPESERPGLTDICAARMCLIELRRLYESPDEETKRALSSSRKLLETFEKGCGVK
jgi:hypothetical protein